MYAYKEISAEGAHRHVPTVDDRGEVIDNEAASNVPNGSQLILR